MTDQVGSKVVYVKSEDVSLNTLILKTASLLRYLKKKWILIAISCALGVTSGVLYVISQHTQYTASLTFALEEDKSATSGFNGLATQFGFDLAGGAGGVFSGGNLYELMRSKTLVEKTLLRPVAVHNREITFADYYIQFNNLKAKDTSLARLQFSVNANRNSLDFTHSRLLSSIAGTVISKMLVINQKDRKTTITNVEVTSIDEVFSKTFAEALVSEVSLFYVQTKSRKARLNVEILEHQVDSIRTLLNVAISDIASTTDNTYNLNPALNIKRVPSTRKQIDVQVNSAMLTQFVQSLALAKISLQKETPLIQVVDYPNYPLEKVETTKIKGAIIGGLLAFIISCVLLLAFKFLNTFRQTYSVAVKFE